MRTGKLVGVFVVAVLVGVGVMCGVGSILTDEQMGGYEKQVVGSADLMLNLELAGTGAGGWD